jgi:hypothetical protein
MELCSCLNEKYVASQKASASGDLSNYTLTKAHWCAASFKNGGFARAD